MEIAERWNEAVMGRSDRRLCYNVWETVGAGVREGRACTPTDEGGQEAGGQWRRAVWGRGGAARRGAGSGGAAASLR